MTGKFNQIQSVSIIEHYSFINCMMYVVCIHKTLQQIKCKIIFTTIQIFIMIRMETFLLKIDYKDVINNKIQCSPDPQINQQGNNNSDPFCLVLIFTISTSLPPKHWWQSRWLCGPQETRRWAPLHSQGCHDSSSSKSSLWSKTKV